LKRAPSWKTSASRTLVPGLLEGRVQAVDRDLARGRDLQAGDVAQEHALARAARPHDDEDLPGLDLERDVLEHLDAAEALRHALDLDADGVGLDAGERVAGLAAGGGIVSMGGRPG
jgi:hypothetical protein